MLEIWDTAGMRLTVTGYGAPSGEEIISAQFVYGALGTCQSATLMVVNPNDTLGRNALWQIMLNGVPVFQGVVDTVTEAEGQLGQVSLMAPHKRDLGAVGGGFSGAVYGVPMVTQAGPYEVWGNVLSKTLQSYPNADFGMLPDGSMVLGLAEYASPSPYPLDERALEIKYLGKTYPNAITDALFDPGEGWQKYVYKRVVPSYALRAAGTASADPAIADKPATVSLGAVILQDSSLAGIGALGIYQRFFGTAPEGYYPNDNFGGGRGSGTWEWHWTYPADTPTRRIREVQISGSLNLAGVAAQQKDFTFMLSGGGGISAQNTGGTTDPPPPEKPSSVTTHETSQDSGTTIEIALFVEGTVDALGRHTLQPKVGNYGTFAGTFAVPADFVGKTLTLRVSIGQSKGHIVQMTVNPASISAKELHPNLAAVIMPDGWDVPFETEPRCEFKLPGWHAGPVRVIDPRKGRIQMRAGTTVTWHRNEASTQVTTAAWAYAKRGDG